MKARYPLFALLALSALFVFPFVIPAHAEATASCPAGEYDMLDWLTLDSDLRGSQYLIGTSNPMYTSLGGGKFYWTKGGNGSPWDINLYDNNYVYLWITEYAWGNPSSYKKFTYNTNVPLVPRCAKGGMPGSTLQVPNTAYDIYTDCNHSTHHTLRHAVNQVWGPYKVTLGGSLPADLPVLVISYRYNCDSNYNNCGDKEEFYLAQRYGNVQWIHYTLIEGKYKQAQKAVFNTLKKGGVTPRFQCF